MSGKQSSGTICRNHSNSCKSKNEQENEAKSRNQLLNVRPMVGSSKNTTRSINMTHALVQNLSESKAMTITHKGFRKSRPQQQQQQQQQFQKRAIGIVTAFRNNPKTQYAPCKLLSKEHTLCRPFQISTLSRGA